MTLHQSVPTLVMNHSTFFNMIVITNLIKQFVLVLMALPLLLAVMTSLFTNIPL